MTIMSGLVGADHAVAPGRMTAGDWFVRNAWGVILTGSTAFWLMIVAFLIW